MNCYIAIKSIKLADQKQQNDWWSGHICDDKLQNAWIRLEYFLAVKADGIFMNSIHCCRNIIVGSRKLLLSRNLQKQPSTGSHTSAWVFSCKFAAHFQNTSLKQQQPLFSLIEKKNKKQKKNNNTYGGPLLNQFLLIVFFVFLLEDYHVKTAPWSSKRICIAMYHRLSKLFWKSLFF